MSNYWSNSLTSMDGSKVPVLLRIAGYFNALDLGSAREKIVIFFKNVEPFFKNVNPLIDNSVSCSSSLSYAYTCNFFTAASNVNGQSYTNYNCSLRSQWTRFQLDAMNNSSLSSP